jgi:hypothetical protein
MEFYYKKTQFMAEGFVYADWIDKFEKSWKMMKQVD